MATDRTDSSLDIYGSHQHPTYAVTSATTAVAGRYYTVNTTGGSVTMTLPTLASTDDGAEFLFWKSVAANSMVIDGAGAETIEGSANITVTAQYTMVRIRKAGTVWQVLKATTNPDGIAGAQLADDSVDSEHIVAGAVDLEHMSANSVDSDQYVDGSIDPAHLAASAVETAAIANANVTPVKLSSGYRTVAEDGAVVLAATDRHINLLSSAAGDKAATMTATHAGHRIDIVLTARSGGSYTFAVTGGNLTFDAAGEGGAIVYDGAAWIYAGPLTAATLV